MSSSEWTTITRSKGKRKHLKMHLSNAPVPGSGLASAWGANNAEDYDLTQEKLLSNFSAQMRKWKNSSCRNILLHYLDKSREGGDWRLTKAFCIASGSFSRANQTNNRRALLQFAAFVDISKHLELMQDRSTALLDSDSSGSASSTTAIQLYAQDPAYTSLDKRFLEHLQVQYIHCPKPQPSTWTPPFEYATPFIDTTTFLFEPFLPRLRNNLRQLYSRFPCLYIGSPFPDRLAQQPCTIRQFFTASDEQLLVECADRFTELNRPELPEMRRRNEAAIRFVESRASGKYFPRFEEDPVVFEGLRVYCLEEGEEAVRDGEDSVEPGQ